MYPGGVKTCISGVFVALVMAHVIYIVCNRSQLYRYHYRAYNEHLLICIGIIMASHVCTYYSVAIIRFSARIICVLTFIGLIDMHTIL